MFIFVKAFIENPEFNSQTKEILKTKQSSFGSTFNITDKFLKGMMKTGIDKEVLEFSQFKEIQNLKKNNGSKKKRVKIPNLDDAEWAGTGKSEQCKLFLTEGLSASTYAIAGLSKIGRQKYGVFPLKGKLLNVRDQSSTKINNNEEITHLKEIIGLKHGHKYLSLSDLRYGGIILLTDSDVDGSHITGLIINMISTFWPELIELGFICSFATSIVKATKRNEVLEFFTLTEFENWKENNNIKGWSFKYYKGLGTSTSKDAKNSFTDFCEKLITYIADVDIEKNINLGFNKKLADDRKKWLLNYDKQNIITQKEKQIPVSDFINKELIHFSYYDTQRSIPSIVDGLKPTQRKILHTGFEYIASSTKEIKVAQFGAKVAEKTSYHHGEKSIFDTIINMSQNYVGSNNLNLLSPFGAFGTRLSGGSDHASERYIYTNIHPLTNKLFNNNDKPLLKYQIEEGQSIEPEWFLPCLPNILINGSLGIGTGFSTNVLPHKLEDIAVYMIAKLNNKKLPIINPNYRLFTGDIIKNKLEKNKYKVYGKYILDNKDLSMTITELPIGTWTKKYKEFIETLLFDKTADKVKIKEQCIKDFNDSKVSPVSVYFKLYFEERFFKELNERDNNTEGREWIYKKFKLVSNISENNMYLFDKDGNIKKYDDIYEILDYFYTFRLEYYQKRKDYILSNLELEMNILKNKVRFIKLITKEDIKITNISDDELNRQLTTLKFDKFKNSDKEYCYDYLINLRIRTLTLENSKKLQNEFNNKKIEFDNLLKITIKQLWINDINELVKEYKIYNKILEKENRELSLNL